MILSLAFALLLSWAQSADKDSQPVMSATNLAYLGCYVWNGREWLGPTPRSARTPILKSPKGFRAYGEVAVTVKDGSCENATKLFVASSGDKEFKIVYTKNAEDSDGNGIRLVGWSPGGDKLLAQVNLWKYETDSGYGRVAVIYSGATGSAQDLKELNAVLSLYFGDACEFDLSVEGWKTDGEILVKVLKTPDTDEYEQHFCVTKPRLMIFDLRKGTIETLQPGH